MQRDRPSSPDRARGRLRRPALIASLLGQVARDVGTKLLLELSPWPPIRPWMKHREIDVIDEILERLRPRNCLEWGAGYGTIYFARHLPGDGRWLSVEHDGAWAEQIRRRASDPHIRIAHVGRDPVEDRPAKGGGPAPDAGFRAYVRFPEAHAPFDFILVDGRARPECLVKAHALIRPEGVVLLHDANREAYQEPLRLYGHQVRLWDGRPWGGGVWMGSKALDLSRVLDVERQRRLWELYSALGRVVRV